MVEEYMECIGPNKALLCTLAENVQGFPILRFQLSYWLRQMSPIVAKGLIDKAKRIEAKENVDAR